jgi:hypothetical protein
VQQRGVPTVAGAAPALRCPQDGDIGAGKSAKEILVRIARQATLLLLVPAFVLSPPMARAAGDAKDPGKSSQAKAYVALLKTVEAGDFEGYKKGHTKAATKQIDLQTKEMKMDAKKTMEFMKTMAPTDLKFTALKVEGKKATLEVTGKVGGEPNKGAIALEEEDGQWKVVSENWTNAK